MAMVLQNMRSFYFAYKPRKVRMPMGQRLEVDEMTAVFGEDYTAKPADIESLNRDQLMLLLNFAVAKARSIRGITPDAKITHSANSCADDCLERIGLANELIGASEGTKPWLDLGNFSSNDVVAMIDHIKLHWQVNPDAVITPS